MLCWLAGAGQLFVTIHPKCVQLHSDQVNRVRKASQERCFRPRSHVSGEQRVAVGCPGETSINVRVVIQEWDDMGWHAV